MNREINTLILDTVDSTSTYARKRADSLTLPSLIIAREQTAGRGRQGKSFYSPADTGVYFTLLFEADESFDFITPRAAVAVCEVLEKEEIFPQIKWVNDIYLGGRKVCGILCERFESAGRTLTAVGIGINLTTREFPENIPLAGSVGKALNPVKTAIKIALAFLESPSGHSRAELLGEYKKRSLITGKEIEYTENGSLFTGKAVDINDDFNLEVETPDGRKVLSSGEVSIIMR